MDFGECSRLSSGVNLFLINLSFLSTQSGSDAFLLNMTEASHFSLHIGNPKQTYDTEPSTQLRESYLGWGFSVFKR